MSCLAMTGELTRIPDPAAELEAQHAAEAGPPEGTPDSLQALPRIRRGRGATMDPPARFESTTAEIFDDGWGTLGDLAEPRPVQTTLQRDAARSVISWNTSPDIGFDRAVNPYRGCEHGCVYCYARPTHAYLGYSPGIDFETRLVFKPDVAALLEKELRRPGYAPRTLALGSNTDPYQPVERSLKLTRSVLEVLERFGHPVSIVTKSAGVLRDMDILERLAARRLVRVWISVTTLDGTLARVMEPRASTPARRLGAVAELTRAGIPAGVFASPMIPGLNDAELEKIVEAAAKAGAQGVRYILLRLPHELREIFENWLHAHFPDRARHVLGLIRETRAGALNQSEFHRRFSGTGVYADMLGRRFARATRRWGMDREPEPLDCSAFAVPRSGGAPEQAQLALF